MREQAKEAVSLASALRAEISEHVLPPSETAPSENEPVLYFALVKGTRGYIEKVAHQVNGCYAHAWYDACLVMIRRLIETLIIELYESRGKQAEIKDQNGDYQFLKDLIPKVLAESSWTIGRAARKALPRLKDLGDKSAHSRTFNAHRQDIDKVIDDLRDVVQELVAHAGLKQVRR